MRSSHRLAAILIAMQPLTVGAGPASPIPVEALFANPVYSHLALSDDGTQLACLHARDDLRVLLVRPVGGGNAVPLAQFDDPATQPNRLVWGNDRRILVSAHARDPKSIGMRRRMTRIFGVDSDGRNFAWLGQDWPVYGSRVRQSGSQDALVHLTPGDPQTILLEYWSRKEQSPQVMRMDVDTGVLALAEKRRHEIYDWYADSDGRVRVGVSTHGGSYRIWARVDAARDFRVVSEHDVLDLDGMRFVAFHRDPGRIYVSSLNDGRMALYEFDLEKRAIGSLVEAHPEVDVTAVERFGPDQQVVGARFTDDRRRVRYFDPRMEAEYGLLQETIERELGRPVDVTATSSSLGARRQVVMASSDRQPPVYYLYDRAVRRIEPLYGAYPDVEADDLAPTRRITFEARDGLAIPAYLTLPVGVEPRALPAVALVHGGPWSRDYIRWDPEVQLLANRGFAVLQVNFRGSAGFGKAFRDAGNREWGQKSHDDITDGVRWLIAEGIADADRIAIMGSSYGGYEALMGLVKTPELYRAGVAYAAVTDIADMLSDDRWLGIRDEALRKFIGGEIGDGARLRENSPLKRAAEIRVPVLLGHGEDDQRVHVSQSRAMARALKAAGADFSYLEFPTEVHGFALQANRIAWYGRVVDFLEGNLAARPAAAAR